VQSETAEDEQLLKEAKVATTGPGLLEFFQRRVPTENDKARITGLIRQLGNSDFQTREKATREVIALGPVALPELQKARKDPDAEVKRRVAQCVEVIEREASPPVTAAAVRLLRARAPAGAIGVLLAFLPHANDEGVEEEITTALLTLGVKDGKVDPLLAVALDDQVPARKAVAAMILARYGTPEQKEIVRKFLNDPDPRIRLRAAQGLVAARQRDAIPPLLALLNEGPLELARQAEDLLTRIAGDLAPKINLEDDKAARRKCREAWDSWWKVNNAKLDLGKADVDLISINPVLQARKVTQQFVDALIKGDALTSKRISAVPFRFLPGDQEFKTADDLGKFLDEIANQRPPVQVTLTVQNVVGIDEYAKIAPEQEKPSVNKLRGPQFRAVYIQMGMGGGQSEGASVFVRLTGGQARVIGIGMGHPARKEVPIIQRAAPAAKPAAPKIEKAPPGAKDKYKN
jgi:hypothetical protein